MSTGPETGGRIEILIVDDEPLVRMNTAAMLEEAGFTVSEASNSDEVLRKLNGGGGRLDALVTDVQMPGRMNGYELAKHVRKLFPNAAIVVISGVARPRQEDLPSNATFLVKPVSREGLLRAINNAV